jgi:hypothetical protein
MTAIQCQMNNPFITLLTSMICKISLMTVEIFITSQRIYNDFYRLIV